MSASAPNPTTEPETDVPQTNFDRLRPHLAADGLAAALLDAWLAEPKTGAAERMLKALDDFGKPKEEADGPATAG